MVQGHTIWIAMLTTAVMLLSRDSAALAQTSTPTPAPPTPGGLPDLSIRLTSNPDPVNSGEILTYSITVRNQGSARPARSARLAVSIPEGTTITGASAGCIREGASVTCQVFPLDPAATAIYSFAVLVTSTSGQVFSRATLDEEQLVEDSDRSNNFATLLTTVRLASPTLTPTVFPPFFGPSLTPSMSPTPTLIPTRPPGISGGPEISPRQAAAPAPAPGSSVPPAIVGAPGSVEQLPAFTDPPVSTDPPPASTGPSTGRDPLVSVPGVSPAEAPVIDTQVWLNILSPTPAYSVTMDLLWTAETGERYLVWLEEEGWALALWEGGRFPEPGTGWVWIGLDASVERLTLDRAALR